MKKTIFWLCMILLLFSLVIKAPMESALCDFAVKSFECFFRSDRAREVFDLDSEEAVAVFGSTSETTLV